MPLPAAACCTVRPRRFEPQGSGVPEDMETEAQRTSVDSSCPPPLRMPRRESECLDRLAGIIPRQVAMRRCPLEDATLPVQNSPPTEPGIILSLLLRLPPRTCLHYRVPAYDTSARSPESNATSASELQIPRSSELCRKEVERHLFGSYAGNSPGRSVALPAVTTPGSG